MGAPSVVAAFALAVAACGQKGPLYLPDRGGAVVTSPAAAPAPQNAPAQPPQSAPAQAPQPPTTTPPKKTDKDSDSQAPH